MKKLRLTACGVALALTACSANAANMSVKLIALNDFHGNLQSPGTFDGKASGGADYIAGYVDRLKSQNPLNAVVSAGDLIGASPLVSSLFHDEGAIETMNRLGLEFNAVGNHEFDEGKDELLRMQNGGCHPTDTENTCKGAEVGTPVPFEGAKFQFLAANVQKKGSKKTIFPGYAIKEFDGVKVAFIGLTLKETPTIVTPSGVAGLRFTDEAQSINHLVPRLKQMGVESIVVLIHQGGVQTTTPGTFPDINQCAGNLAGTPIQSIVSKLDDEIDLVISGHTHAAYICNIANRDGREIPVTSANALGRVLTNIDLSIDTGSKDVAAVAAQNLVVDRANVEVTPNAEIQGIVDNYAVLAGAVSNRIIGSIGADITRAGQFSTDILAGASGESALGDVIADAQLDATDDAGFGDAVVAFMNPGGIRAELFFASGTALEGDGNVTFGEAFTVQPFGNSLVTMTLAGAQIKTLLQQQFPGCGQDPGTFRILQPSAGFSYRWDAGKLGKDVDDKDIVTDCASIIAPGSIRIGGKPVLPGAKYRVTVNSFLADGGDKFAVLTKGTNRLGGAQDIDALEAYFKAHSPVQPGPKDRILR